MGEQPINERIVNHLLLVLLRFNHPEITVLTQPTKRLQKFAKSLTLLLLGRSQQMSSKNLVRNTNIQVLKSRDNFVMRFAFLSEIVHGMRHATYQQFQLVDCSVFSLLIKPLYIILESPAPVSPLLTRTTLARIQVQTRRFHKFILISYSVN